MCERNSNKQVTSVGSTISSKLNPKLELDSSQTDDTSIAATSTAVTIHSSNLNKKLVKIKKFKLEDMKEMVGGCCVCSDERGWPENPLVYCDGQNCTVAVHQACYGIVTVPTGPWYCRKCESQERTSRVRCELCPSRDGALKKTDNSGWAHVVCALYIPEVRFGNVTTMEPIILTLIPQERYSKTCYICLEIGKPNRANVGACMQCNKSNCKQQFHVTCAQSLGLLCEEAGNYLDNVKYCGYCQHHYSKLKKGGNVKTIPPYKPIQHDTSSDSCSSPEKEIDSTINAASTSATSIKITSTTNLGTSNVGGINTGGIGGVGSGVSSTKQRKGNASGKSSSSSSSSSSSGSSTGSGGGGGLNVSGTDRPNPSTSSTSACSAISMTNTSAGTSTFTGNSNISNLAGSLTGSPASTSPNTGAGGPVAATSTTLPSLAANSSSVSSANAVTKFSTSTGSASSTIYKDKHSKNLNKSSSNKDKEKDGSANNASNNNLSSMSSINSSLSGSGSSLSSASTKSSSKSNKNKDLMQVNVTTSITTQSSSTSTIASNSSTSGSNISSSTAGTTSTSSSLTSSSNEHVKNLSINQASADSELSRSGPNPSSINDSNTSSFAINLEPRDHGLTQRTGTTTTTAGATNLSTSKGLTSSTSSGSSTNPLTTTSTSNPSTTSSSSSNSTSKKRKADSIKSSSAISASAAALDENSSFRDIIKDVQVTLTPLTDFEKEIEKTSKRQRTELSPPTHQSSATAEVNATLAPAACAAISTTSATGTSSSSGSTTTANTSSSNIASGSVATISGNNNAITGSGLPASNFAKSDISKTIGSGSKHGTNGGNKDTTSTSGSSSSSANQQQATGANTNAPSLYVSVPLSTANVPGINLPNASGSVPGNGTGTSIDSSQSAIRSGSTPVQTSVSNQNQSSLGTPGNTTYVTPHTANSVSGTINSSNTSTSASSSSLSSSALSSSVIQHQHTSGKSTTVSALSGGTSGALVSGNCGGNIISSTSTSTTHSSGNLTATTTESGNLKISYEKQANRVQQLQEQESSPGRRSRTPDLNSGTVSTSAISASGNSNTNSSSFSGLKFTYEAQSQLDVAMLPVSSIKDSPPSSPGSEIGVIPHPTISNQPPAVNTSGAAVGGNVRKRGRKAKDTTQAAAQTVADLKDVRILQNGGNNSVTASNSATTIGSPLVPAPTPPATPSISVSASSSSSSSSTSIIAHTATHMLGNHVNPNSSVAQKLSEQLHMEVQDHAIYTPDSMNSQFTGVPFPGKQRNSTTSSSSGNITNTIVAPNPLQSMFGGGGINGNMPIPQSLEQLLERQWEQGSQFLMEQAQHFDIASLLNCLHQLQSENLRLEEHVTSLIARRDHLLAVNARLQIPLSTISNNAKAEAHASGGNNSNISNALNAATTIAAAVSLATTAINTTTPTGNSRATVAPASSSGVVLDYRGSSGNNNSNCSNSASATANTPTGGPSSTPSSGSQGTGMSIGSMAMSNVTNFALRHLASTHATYNNAGTNSSNQSQQQNSVAPATIGRVPTKARR